MLGAQLLLICFLAFPNSPAVSQNQQAPGQSAATESIDPNVLKADKIGALIDGTLDPDVASEDLFRVSIAGSANSLAQRVLELVSDDELYGQASEDLSVLQPLTVGEAELALVQARFLRLPEARRDRLLSEHRQRFEAAQRTESENEAQSAQISSLRAELTGLRDFLDGNETSLTSLHFDLADYLAIGSLDEAGTDAQAPGASEYPADADFETRRLWLRNEIARKKNHILRLPSERLAELLRGSSITIVPSDDIATADAALEEAQAELRDAEQAAVLARDEQTRLLATQNAALLEIRQSQAEVRAELARFNAELTQISENTLRWQQRVDLLIGGNAGTREVDRAYDELVRDLAQARADFRSVLGRADDIESDRIYPQPIDVLLAIPRPEVSELAERYAELDEAAGTLNDEYGDAVWARRTTLHDTLTRLNEARLALIPSLSREKRSQVTGFGGEGVAQARREVSQIALQARYYLSSWPRLVSEGARFTPQLIFELGWIVLAIFVFRAWRRRGDELLGYSYRDTLANRPENVSKVIFARILHLWRRVRRPLDWSVFLLVLSWLWPAQYYFPGIVVMWLILFWTACTLLLMTLVNELAGGGANADPRAELRWNSLRLIGAAILAVALLLEISQAMVGKGAIYHWVSTLAWALVPILIVVLTWWWKDRIRELALAEAERNSFLSWISRRPTAPANLLPYALAGIILLLAGIRSVIGHEVSKIALVREIGQQKERDEAARRVAEDKASGRYRSLPREASSHLNPHIEPGHALDDRTWPGALARPRIRPDTITVIVGDRGSGKSTMLRDAARSADRFDRCIQISVDERGLQGIKDDLSKALDLVAEEVDVANLQSALASADEEIIIAVDDIHRLVVPAINGLADFDTLTEIACNSGEKTAWILSIERVCWDFLERARFDRLVFDNVIRMEPWTNNAIRDLIERRTQRAELDPNFDTVLDAGVFGIGGDLSPIERKRASYFQRLHHYADGNPAIALEFWRRSLFVVEETGEVVVLTFAIPDADRLSDLPLPALIVLRSVLQMGLASVSSIERSTDMREATVSGILRRLQHIGAVQPRSGRYMVSLEWWLEACRLLERRNLVIRRSI